MWHLDTIRVLYESDTFRESIYARDVNAMVSPPIQRPGGHRAAGHSGGRFLHPVFLQRPAGAVAGRAGAGLPAGMAHRPPGAYGVVAYLGYQRGAGAVCWHTAADVVCGDANCLAAGN